MPTLVLIRHGESQWNLENRFTGWTDIDLSPNGITQAETAGDLLKAHGFTFNRTYTSVLKRAIRTLWISLDRLDQMWIPVEHSWRLNERHYGALQGLNKDEMREQYGEEQVHLWRRSYDVQPPALDPNDPRHPKNDPRYAGIDPATLPLTESLEDTQARMLPYWHETIGPAVARGEQVLIAAHGNSLRSLIQHLDRLSPEEIMATEIPYGKPLVYELDESLTPIRHSYLE